MSLYIDRTLVFLDLETTGLVPTRDRIIEVGAVKVKGPLVQETFTALVNPGVPIPLYITKLTGITDREILEKGQPLDDVLPALKEFVQDCPMVGHNLDFDLAFLKAGGFEFKNNPRLDTGLFTALISPAEKSYSLSALIKKFFQETEVHRSLSDARHTFKLFRGLLDRLMEIDNSLLKGWISLLQEEEPLLSEIFQAVVSARESQDKKDSFASPHPDPLRGCPALPKVGEGRVRGKKTKSLKKRISAILAEGGILSRLSGYEYRPQQLEMAQMVEQALSGRNLLVVEAPTGVGKSLSYLVPAVLFADATQKKVVISTNTKNLQAQIWEKEIPFLREILKGLKWQASRLLGRENYFCRRRFQKIFDSPRTLLSHDRVILAYLLAFCHRSEEGILSESAHFLVHRFPALRGYLEDLRATSEECLLKSCPFYQRCFYQAALKTAETADVIISNHALTLSPPAGFPEFDYLVLDEAHNVEDAATETYSHIMENATINRMLALVRIKEKSQEIKDLWFRSSNHLLALLPETGTKSLEYLKKDKRWPAINLDLENFLLVWQEVENLLRKPKEEGGGEANLLAKKFQDVRDTFGLVLNPPDNYVSFAGREGTGRGNWFLKTSPVDVALVLRTHLFDNLKSAVLTSATLTVAGRFNFFLRRWGLADVPNLSTAVLDSPFDFSTQAVLGIPRNFYCYRYEEGEENFVAALSEGIKKSALILRGKELVLFASRFRMETVYRRIKEEMEKKGITVFCQNIDGSRRSLVERLKESTDDCLLFGTKSFQEGVDISGLTAVIIEKIPFPGQSDPLISARQKAVEKEGGQPFRDYTLPLAIISLRQSFGRLIRRKADRGVVIIFDSRLVESYSEVFNSFPNTARIIEDIPVFYEKLTEMKARFT